LSDCGTPSPTSNNWITVDDLACKERRIFLKQLGLDLINEQMTFRALLLDRYCYDLNFAVNRKGENVLEHSRTGSQTPTSGTGRVNSARGGEKI
jgi:hypothetical protein